jgi:nitroreductase
MTALNTATLTPDSTAEAEGMDAIALRYGGDGPERHDAPNAVIETMLAHRSVRGYRPDPLPDGALETIIAAAQSAASSSNLQTWSVIAVTDPARKDRLADLAGLAPGKPQAHISECPVFLCFLADLARLNRIADREGLPRAGNDTLEMLLVASIDAALAAQNACLAAQSMGLSTVYIGAMRNHPREVAAELGLPPGAFVAFGLCIGTASEGKEGAIKPRLPQAAVLHREQYDLAGQDAAIQRYIGAMRSFNASQGLNATTPWTVHSARRVADGAALGGRDRLGVHLRALGLLAAEGPGPA